MRWKKRLPVSAAARAVERQAALDARHDAKRAEQDIRRKAKEAEQKTREALQYAKRKIVGRIRRISGNAYGRAKELWRKGVPFGQAIKMAIHELKQREGGLGCPPCRN